MKNQYYMILHVITRYSMYYSHIYTINLSISNHWPVVKFNYTIFVKIC